MSEIIIFLIMQIVSVLAILAIALIPSSCNKETKGIYILLLLIHGTVCWAACAILRAIKKNKKDQDD